MQVNEMKQRFNQFEQCVEDAKQACQQDSSVPQQLASNIQDLDREVHRAHDLVQGAQQQSAELVQCIDRLEQMGDNVKQACQQAGSISDRTQNACMDVHRQISDLKHQMH